MKILFAALLLLPPALPAQPGWRPVAPERAAEVRALRFGLFVCWSFSTFSNVEWTRGVKDVAFFNPLGCEPDQWAAAARSAEMRYLLFLAKHHDGFCLWDTATTGRKVTKSPLGRDVLAEVRRACAARGLRLALYFSEGDWTWPAPYQRQGGGIDPERKKAQLRELLTGYGPIEFIWFDYAVGDGGLDHEATTAFVKSLQPACLVGYNGGPPAGDLRIGEMGRAAPLPGPGTAERFVAAEFTYPILRGRKNGRWFYTMPEWDEVAVSVGEIYQDWREAERHGNIFSLDVGPDRRGRLRPIDAARLAEVGRCIRGEASPPPVPASQGRPARASSSWSEPDYGPAMAFDGDPGTRWGAARDARSAWLEVDLGGPTEIGRAVIDEGDWNRVRRFALRAEAEGSWRTVAAGTTLGRRTELPFPPVTARRFRLEILEAAEVPTILELELHPR